MIRLVYRNSASKVLWRRLTSSVTRWGQSRRPSNYRDEFDPLFPNRRRGWHKRPTRAYCLNVFEEYKNIDFEIFTDLVKSFFGYDENVWSEFGVKEQKLEAESNFAKRLITGLAAERYFESVQPSLPEFKDYSVENMTRIGCGYDFRLRSERCNEFLAVEVKGLKDRAGSLSLTPKEHEVARTLGGRFFLFVVKNFREVPFHQVYQDPLSGTLQFTRIERVTVQISWMSRV